MDWNNDGKHTSEDDAIFHNLISTDDSSSNTTRGANTPGCGFATLVLIGVILLFFKILSLIF